MQKPKVYQNKIFKRLRAGERISMDDPDYHQIGDEVNRRIPLMHALNNSEDKDAIRNMLGQVIGAKVDESTTVFIPFYTNLGFHISLGKNVFINHACSFLDLGEIIIEDDVMIGPRVSITSENHPIEIENRKTMVPARVVIKRNAWIGASATILPGVTIGENAVVAAGALVNKSVPANTVVGGVPAKVIKTITRS